MSYCVLNLPHSNATVEKLHDYLELIEVVDRVSSIEEIYPVIATNAVDVLTLGMKNTVLRSLCVDIMDRISNLAIVGLINDSRQLAVYLDNLGKNNLLKIIRVLRRSNREHMF